MAASIRKEAVEAEESYFDQRPIESSPSSSSRSTLAAPTNESPCASPQPETVVEQLRMLWPKHSERKVVTASAPARLENLLLKPINLRDVFHNNHVLSSRLRFNTLNAKTGKPGRLLHTLKVDPKAICFSYLYDTEVTCRIQKLCCPSPGSSVTFDLTQNPSLNDRIDRALAYGAYNNPANHILAPGQPMTLATLNDATDGGFYAKGYFCSSHPAAYSLPSSPIIHADPRFCQTHALPGSFVPGGTLVPRMDLGACLYPTLNHYNATHLRRTATQPPICNLPVVPAATYYAGWAALKRQQFLPYFLRFADAAEAEVWCPPLLLLKKEGIDLARGEPHLFAKGKGTVFGAETERVCEREQSGRAWMTFQGLGDGGEQGVGCVVGMGL